MKGTITLILLFSTLLGHGIGQSIVINELMSDNSSTLPDEDGDWSDWIELYNSSEVSINLNGYHLSDDRESLDKWTLPDIDLQPKSFLIIIASGKDSKNIDELHANFKIASNGEAIYLSSPSTMIDSTASVSLKSDQVYQRFPDGGDDWGMSILSSPEMPNIKSSKLSFSHQAGFYASDFTLSIESDTEDEIYYTLNGDIPTSESLLLVNPIPLSDQSHRENFFSEFRSSATQEELSFHAWQSPSTKLHKAVVLRCASFDGGLRTSPIHTKTYFIDPEISSRYSMPIISLVTEGNNFFDAEKGIYVPGDNLDSSNPGWSGNYFMTGDEWERNIHIEYFEQNGTLGFSQGAGVRIHGGKTRQAAQKSLRLYARSEYGDKNFDYPLFPQKDVTQYKRFLLRTTMGAWGKETIIKDVLAQEIVHDMDVETQDYQPVIVYLNGEYWGIHTLRDRLDEHYIEYSHSIDKDSVEFFEWGNSDYGEIISFVENSDLSLDANYQEVITQIDIENFIDYMIAELFFSNYDWPSNNLKYWREIPDGKWRWIFYDIDGGFRSKEFNMLEHATLNDPNVSMWPNPPYSTLLFRSLLESETFKQQFLNRYAYLLNNDFNPETTLRKLSEIKAMYRPEIQGHSDRWHFPNSVENWENDVQSDLGNYLNDRPCFVRQNIVSFFDLDDFGYECDTTTLTDVDEILLFANPNNGAFTLWNNYANLDQVNVSVYNMSGQLIYDQDEFTFSKNEKVSIDLQQVVAGIYTVSIKAPDYRYQIKMQVIE